MNTIALRISDFLKNYPPFDALSAEELLKVSASINIVHLEKGDKIFNLGDRIRQHFYVVRNGAIGLYRGEQELVDHCDEGDLFGLRALLRQDSYQLEAKTIEESIVYTISKDIWLKHIASNTKAVAFVMGSLASNVHYKNASKDVSSLIPDEHLEQLLTIEYSKNPVVCHKNQTIKEAANIMANQKVGSIIITEDNKPIGIITDKDLRIKVATGLLSITEKVTSLMSSPVITVHERITVAEAQLAMLRHKITHLCITKDGTANTSLTGVLSEHDIVVLRELTAASLIKEIKRSKSVSQLRQIRLKAEVLLKKYLEQGAPIEFIGKILSAINDAITHKIITTVLTELGPAPCKFSWIAIGSQGRQEQLLMTDQDNALVFENVESQDIENTRNYFLKLANQVNSNLATVGFELCPAQMMASNSDWCLSVSEWQNTFKNWILEPNQDKLMLCTIFFDFQCVYGDQTLINSLSKTIFDAISKNNLFLNYLGRNALENPPPLSFFRQFLVEESGGHKDQFDIKARALMPLVDSARLLILSHGMKSVNNTRDRYLKLADLEPQNKDTFLRCAEGFTTLLKYRTHQGLIHEDTGRFINLKTLNKQERLKLKQSFKSIREIQDLIKTRFKLTQLM